MSQFANEAAWIVAEKTHPLEVGPGPTPAPDEHEVVIKVAYAAVNPTDCLMQTTPYRPLPYPFIFGTDVAGTVVQIGSKVTKFQLGQRVTGHCDSLLTIKATNAGFQRYSTCRERLVSAVPDNVPLANAAVLPLAVDTAASALFIKLALPLPTCNPKPINKTILIWGGSSSVGSCAIQLAVAAGLRVIATASKANFDAVRRLGAAEVFDHRDVNVEESILKQLKPGDYVLDCISIGNTQQACGNILGAIGGGTLPVMRMPDGNFPENVTAVLVNGLAPGLEAHEAHPVWGGGEPRIGEYIWHEYMPAALEKGQFQAKPDPQILTGGLSRVQEGIDTLAKGVSAVKLVIEIEKEA